MEIAPLAEKDRSEWNTFVAEQFPPVGAFLQSWEWGTFKGILHEKVIRFAIRDGDMWIGCFQLEIHALPAGFKYGYAPRGPVLRKELWSDSIRVSEIFAEIINYLRKNYPSLIFVRLEPPHKEQFDFYFRRPFRKLPQYLQPRFNQLIRLDDADELLKTFVSDVRHDIRAAQRLGIVVTNSERLSPEDTQAFEEMKAQTGARSGKNIFPSNDYFLHFLDSFKEGTSTRKSEPSLRYFIARNKEGVPVAINLNLLFADTHTYLYGASYSGARSKRAPAYLHFQTMLHAREDGYEYYDLGGVDPQLWQGLTYFKQQFGGEMTEYIGTLDVVMKPSLYALYCTAKNTFRTSLHLGDDK